MWDFIDSGYAWDFLIGLGLHALAALILAAVLRARKAEGFRKRFLDWIVPSYAMSVIGLAVGVLSGSSRVYAADVVVPAVLMAFVGFCLWLHSRTYAPDRLRILVLTAVFSFFVLIGTFSGWAMDSGYDDGSGALDQNARLEQPRA